MTINGYCVEVVKRWITKAGLEAVILLVNKSHHCGYVVSPDWLINHRWDDESVEHIIVHGGITYSNHLAELGDKWVFGYDCAHCDDKQLCPPQFKGTGIEDLYTSGTWRDEEYCTEECESLAMQLMETNNFLLGN